MSVESAREGVVAVSDPEFDERVRRSFEAAERELTAYIADKKQ